MVMPAPYTVSLVSPDVIKGIDKRAYVDKVTNADKEREENVVQETKESAAPSASTKKSKKEIAKEKEMLEKKISAIAAKKKIEKIVKLRSIIALKASGDKRSSNEKTASASPGKGNPSEDYYTKITKEIWQQWVYPNVGKKDIEAVVSIKILMDGTAIVQKIEKSSGNSIFDKSALRALAKASPLPPPPYEMEIGVRFYP
jgi:colicin import membrane protein